VLRLCSVSTELAKLALIMYVSPSSSSINILLLVIFLNGTYMSLLTIFGIITCEVVFKYRKIFCNPPKLPFFTQSTIMTLRCLIQMASKHLIDGSFSTINSPLKVGTVSLAPATPHLTIEDEFCSLIVTSFVPHLFL
jgi:hypothetical protein